MRRTRTRQTTLAATVLHSVSASGVDASAGHPPSADPADISRFDRFQFDEVGVTVVAEQAIEAIAQYRLVCLGLGPAPRKPSRPDDVFGSDSCWQEREAPSVRSTGCRQVTGRCAARPTAGP